MKTLLDKANAFSCKVSDAFVCFNPYAVERNCDYFDAVEFIKDRIDDLRIVEPKNAEDLIFDLGDMLEYIENANCRYFIIYMPKNLQEEAAIYPVTEAGLKDFAEQHLIKSKESLVKHLLSSSIGVTALAVGSIVISSCLFWTLCYLANSD